jgi:hypothetical protein
MEVRPVWKWKINRRSGGWDGSPKWVSQIQIEGEREREAHEAGRVKSEGTMLIALTGTQLASVP